VRQLKWSSSVRRRRALEFDFGRRGAETFIRFTTSLLDFLPDAGALAQTTEAIKEWIGLAVYRVRGWA
jgi:hypothetical protein